MRRRTHRVGVLALTSLGLLLLIASPAAAHGRGSDATNFRSTITEEPGLPGVSWRIYGGDELLEVTNAGGAEILVLGYDGEPYLRVGPEGVFTNRRSPATYLNEDRYAVLQVPPEADSQAEPEWEHISTGTSHAWHDHRIHWMSPDPPPAVQQAGLDQETVVYDAWEVPFQSDGEDHVLVGELRWVPGPSPWPWLALGLVLTLPALAGLRTEPVGARWPGAARPAAAVLAGLVLLNATHLVDDLFAVPLPGSMVAISAGQTLLFLAIGAFGAVRGWQAGDGAFTAIGVGSGAILVGQGLLYWSVLQVSQVASVFPPVLARVAVGASVAQIVPLGIVAVVGTRRLLPPPEEEATAGTEA